MALQLFIGMEILYMYTLGYITIYIHYISVYINWLYTVSCIHSTQTCLYQRLLVCFKIRKRQLAKFPRINHIHPHPFIVGPGGSSMALWSIIRVAVGFTRWDTPLHRESVDGDRHSQVRRWFVFGASGKNPPSILDGENGRIKQDLKEMLRPGEHMIKFTQIER